MNAINSNHIISKLKKKKKKTCINLNCGLSIEQLAL